MKRLLVLSLVVWGSVFGAEWTDDDFNGGILENVQIKTVGTETYLQLEERSGPWLSGWGYRRPITINNSGTQTLSNYQIAVRFFNGDSIYSHGGTSSLRVTDSDGTTTLPLWTENWNTSGTSTIWTKLNLPLGTKTIYVYYGNQSATSTSNFDAVFTKDYGESGLVGLWHMDEGKGGTIADSSGKGNNGTLTNGPTWQSSDGGQWDGRSDVKFGTGSCLNFNGVNSYVNLEPFSDVISNDFTIMAWVKWKGTGEQWIISDFTNESPYYCWCISTRNAHLTFDSYPSSGRHLQEGTTVLSNDTWYYIVVTGDYVGNGSNPIKTYLNSRLETTANAGNDKFWNPSGILSISTACSPYPEWNGFIDEVRIYNRTLSANEIKAHYERRKYAYPEPATATGTEEGLYAKAGTFTSSVCNLGGQAQFGSLSWVNSGVGSITFQIATSTSNGGSWNFAGPQGNTSYYTVNGQTISSSPAQYICYKSFLSAKDTSSTPKLDKVKITYSLMGKPDPWINYGPFGSNPDIAVFFGTQRVNPCCLQAGATYTLVATVHNKEIPAEGVIVRFYIAGGLAIGGGFQQIGTVTVNLLANATATAATLWQVPRTGHGCIQVKLFYQNDANLKNNFAQQNANAFGVASTLSKDRKIVIGNPLEKKGTVTLKLKYPSGIQVTPNLQIIVLNPGETITATIDIKNTGLAPGAIATVEVEGVIETEDGTETIGGVMFIVSAGRISEITPISGIVGTTVTVKGEGYGQNETIRIDFGTTLSVAIAITDTQGSFSATFKPGYQEIAVGVPINIIATSLSSGSIDFGSFTLLSGAKIRISPETTTVSLYTQCDIKIDIEGVNNLSGAMVELGFDKSILKPLSAKRGSFFGGEGESIFCPVISENNVVINASRLGGNVSGSGTIAIITFSGLSSGTTKINIGNVDLRDSELNRISVDSFPGMVVIEGYLADFGMLDTQDKIIEKPDYKIDFYDLMLFTKNWKGSKSRYDIWPATGTPPCFALSPDGKIDFEDLVVFTLMWNWYNPSTPTKSALSLEKPKVKVVSKGENLLKGDEFDVDLSIEGAERIMAGHFEIGFNPDVVELLSVKEGEALSQSGGKPVFFQEKQRARGEIDMAILGGAFSGSGVVATLRFKVLADEPAIKIGLLSDLRDLNNKKVNAETTDGELGILPSTSSLLQSFPNPADYGCWIPFQLTAGSDVSVEIYNVVGQRVKGIDAGPRKAGSYTQAKEGYAIFWNRTNDAGEKVSRGLYFYKLQAGKFSDVKSLVVE